MEENKWIEDIVKLKDYKEFLRWVIRYPDSQQKELTDLYYKINNDLRTNLIEKLLNSRLDLNEIIKDLVFCIPLNEIKERLKSFD